MQPQQLLLRPVVALWRRAEQLHLGRQLRSIPKTRLREEHLEGAELLLDRQQLVSKLPRHGTVAELGVDEGKFTEVILRDSEPAKLYLVDPWDSQRYGDDKFAAVQRKLAGAIDAGRVEILRTTSLEAAQRFPDSMFDWIYIDTTHSYELTIAELRAWAPKVKPQGFIAGHDYVMGNWRTAVKYGVIEAVAEFCVEQDWRIAYLTADFVEKNSFAIRRLR